MKYVDDIIRFLSKEMKGEEESNFRRQLSQNKDLNIEYQQINTIWIQLREYLSLEKLENSMTREELIAELIAEQDIISYRDENESNKTKRFRTKLHSIINNETIRKRSIKRQLYILSFASAAMIALLLIVREPWRNTNDLLNIYYSPENESLLYLSTIHTRADSVSAMELFSKASYMEAMSLFEIEISKNPKDDLLKLCYGLSCYESGHYEKAIVILEEIATNISSEYTDLSAWYLSLIFAKEKHIEKSKAWLIKVKQRKCLYSRDASRLLRKI